MCSQFGGGALLEEEEEEGFEALEVEEEEEEEGRAAEEAEEEVRAAGRETPADCSFTAGRMVWGKRGSRLADVIVM